MRERTLRFILDSIFCMDAMSPEFKKANDILLRIVKMNDRTDGLPHTRLVEINKAFKENDAKAARAAFDKLKPLLAKGDKDLQDGLTEARSKLSEASQKAEQTKAAAVAAKGAVALFDKFRKAIDGVKAKPASVSKLSAYADKLKAYGDFSKRIAQMSQMVAAKKDVSKQADVLASACDKGKAKADKERTKAEKDYGAAKDRVSVFKEMEKIRSKKIAEFAKEKEDVQKLGAALPLDDSQTKAIQDPTNEAIKLLQKLKPLFKKYKEGVDREFAEAKKNITSDINEYLAIKRNLVRKYDELLPLFDSGLKGNPGKFKKDYKKAIERIKDCKKILENGGVPMYSGPYAEIVAGFNDRAKILVRQIDKLVKKMLKLKKNPELLKMYKLSISGDKPSTSFFGSRETMKHFREIEPEVMSVYREILRLVPDVDFSNLNAYEENIYKRPNSIISEMEKRIKMSGKR